MFFPNDTWICAQLPDRKHFFLGGGEGRHMLLYMGLFHPPLRLSIFYGSRDQLRPGSFLHKKNESGNEVALSSYAKIELFSQVYDTRQPIEFPLRFFRHLV